MSAGPRRGLLYAALLAVVGMPRQCRAAGRESSCIDQEEACSSWADGGECFANPGYMSQACCASCAKHGVARQVSWEDEDLTVSADGSAILNLTPESLEDKVRSGDLLIVWFYAPWCKQCKLVRPALEQAAQALAGHVAFGRLDCAQHPSAKRAHGVYSYPAFKAFRAGGSRWVEVPKARTVSDILAASRREVAGPFTVAASASELHDAVFLQARELEMLFSVRQADEGMLFAGVGEAAVVAHLPDMAPSRHFEFPPTAGGTGAAGTEEGGTGAGGTEASSASEGSNDTGITGTGGTGAIAAAALRFESLAAGWPMRGSPLPFLVATSAEAIQGAGLPDILPLHAALLTLSPDGARVSETILISLAPATAVPASADSHATVTAATAAHEETAADSLAPATAEHNHEAPFTADGASPPSDPLLSHLVSHRLSLHIDFNSDPTWPKRAAQLSHIQAQLLLFVRRAHAADLIAEVSEAAGRFRRGATIVFSFEVTDEELSSPGPLLRRYGVLSVMDVPRLVINHNQNGGDAVRVPFEGATLDAPSVFDFLLGLQLPLADNASSPRSEALERKDEL